MKNFCLSYVLFGGLLMLVSYAVNINIKFMALKTFGAFEVVAAHRKTR